MAMIPFFSTRPDIAAAETRTLTMRGSTSLPDGHYGFIEHYCDDPDCDCRRVLIVVYTPATGNQVWATISYGWESAAFYRKWDKHSDDDLRGPFLDPLGAQSPYAQVLLGWFATMVEDDAYVARLRRHYAISRQVLRSPRHGKANARLRVGPRRRRRP